MGLPVLILNAGGSGAAAGAHPQRYAVNGSAAGAHPQRWRVNGTAAGSHPQRWRVNGALTVLILNAGG
uniref:hypothetical protein n=1 Tax=Klebsiella pneumoniae TaxID=573 RepID=UPI00155D9E80|nr:hypothetical protein [Klebsiella pneumoniae]